MLYFILGGLTVWVILSCIIVFALDKQDPLEWDNSILFSLFFPADILIGTYDLILRVLKKIKTKKK